MNSELYTNIVNGYAYRISRDENAQLILINADLFPNLLELALNLDDKNHYKACWILELVLEKQINFVPDHLPVFSFSLSKFTNESALRSISKISFCS
jgi:hypothetical protein